MTETENSKTNFAGTYFDHDSVLRLARLAEVAAWITLIYHLGQALLTLLIYILQISRGLVAPLGFTDVSQQIFWMLQPVLPGLWYFIGIQAIGKLLLIFMDMEDNTRRAARNK